MDGLFIKVALVDGTAHTEPISPRVIVGFERQFGKGFAKLLSEDQKYEHLCWIGHQTLKNKGVVLKPFDGGFLDEMESVELVSDPSSESTETP
jgi:hypothetical protein